jgi:hypothetical protein
MLLTMLYSLWHAAMLSYLSRGQSPNVTAGVSEIFLSIFAPSLLRFNAQVSVLLAATVVTSAVICAMLLLPSG